MNTITAQITDIQRLDNLSLVSFDASGTALQMMALGLSEKIHVGANVLLGVQSSHLVLAKEISGTISTPNHLKCKVVIINRGALLCSVTVEYVDTLIESLITLAAADALKLSIGDKVTCLIAPSDLSIVEVRS